MSLIAGIIRFSGEPVIITDLEATSARMIEPGIAPPQFWSKDGAGFIVRQAVYTSEDQAEKQPWVGRGGQWILIHDGRLDNREELARELGVNLTHETVPDGKLLLLALERWGEATLPRLVGNFVFALWDMRQRRLLLARDQMGRRTLYYHHGNGFMAFANTYPALLALPGVPNRVDVLGIADFLVLNMHHPVNTFYEQVRRIPKASSATCDANGLKFSVYWSAKPDKTIRLSNDDEYAEAAREQLERAVACQLRAKDGIAAQISGGLDSSAVATTAARLLAPSRLLAICTVPPAGLELPTPNPTWYNDERPYLAQIAPLHPHLDIQTVSSDGPHWIEKDPSAFFDVSGLPLRNISNVGWFMPAYERVAQDGAKVLLTGQGGNSAWSYDGLRSLSELFLGGHWLRLARELYLADKRKPFGFTGRVLLSRDIVNPLLPQGLLRLRQRISRCNPEPWSHYSAINPAFAQDIGLVRRCQQAGYDPGFTGPANSLAMMSILLNGNEHGADVVTALRSFSGIELRTPLLDIRLVEFFLSLPQEQFMKDGITRRIARRALRDRLPQAVLEKEQLGKQNPEIRHRLGMMRDVLATDIEELQNSPLASLCIDLRRLKRIVDQWPQHGLEVQLMLPRALNVAHFLRWTERNV